MNIIELQNPFDYESSTVQYIETQMDVTQFCGDKIEVHDVFDQTYHVCKGCGTIISQSDLEHVIENRDIEEDRMPASFRFLETHAIFRCEDGHDEDLHWTFQCLVVSVAEKEVEPVDFA